MDTTPSVIAAKPLWTIKEVAAYLRCTPRTVSRLMARRKIPFSRPCGPRFDPEKIKLWAERSK